eukprot:11670821-Karenia_brevis.AAC.1
MRNKATRKVIEDKPTLLIGSPPCTYFSQLMRINWSRMDPDEAWRKWEQAVEHVSFCMKLYSIQIEAGRYFLHEHPLSASSWQLPSVEQ